jgi:threonine synthase
LCAPTAANGYEVLKMLKDSRGTAIAVDEASIAEGTELVDKYTGFLTEPVGGAVIAAAKRLVRRGSINPNETTVLVLTDSYRKGSEVVIPEGISRGKIIEVEPRSPAVKKALEEILGMVA